MAAGERREGLAVAGSGRLDVAAKAPSTWVRKGTSLIVVKIRSPLPYMGISIPCIYAPNVSTQ